jgi:hypothetical protein
MDDDKEDKSLFQKAIETVKEVASSVTEVIASAPPSQRAEPAPEENFDAPPMTADELAEHAAADTQPPAEDAPASPNLSGRITPTYDIPVPDTPMPSPKKRKAVKKSSKKSAKKASKKTAKKAAKKVTKKTAKKFAKKTVKKRKTPSRSVKKKKKAKRG